MKNFDVFVFVRFLRDFLRAFKDQEYLITVQAGFRYNTGRGKFIINDFSYK
jgi:hypothetical protein